jgi:hypothetical protein
VKKSDVLMDLQLGSNVAELDEGLENYFIKTVSTNEFIKDRYDIIKGVKGAGKSALLIVSTKKQECFEELNDVVLIPATGHHGDPAFKRAFSEINMPANEEKLKESWLLYIVNIVWPIIKEKFPNDSTGLERYLRTNRLIIDNPNLWERALFSIKRILPRTELRGEVIDPQGYTYAGQVVLGENEVNIAPTYIDFNYIFTTIDEIVGKNDKRLWVLLDRLDEAFDKEIEETALKSLLSGFKDLMKYRKIKVKIFIRNDIYDIVTQSDGFAALSHVSAKANRTLKWTDDKLLHLLAERFLTNKKFENYLTCIGYSIADIKGDLELFLRIVFPKQVNSGQRKPTTYRWIIGRITDGEGNMTPRDLISLVENARSIQLDKWETKGNEDSVNYLIGPEALTEAWQIVSQDKIKTQLFAEYKNLRDYVQKFRKSKAEHNESSLEELLGDDWRKIISSLEFIGFIQKRSNTWKIPLLYRPGLEVAQGKAFSIEQGDEEDDEM